MTMDMRAGYAGCDAMVNGRGCAMAAPQEPVARAFGKGICANNAFHVDRLNCRGHGHDDSVSQW